MVDLEKDLSNFKLNIDKKDITIKEYIRLLTLGKKEYQKLLEENKKLKEALVRASKTVKKHIKRKYIIEQTDSEQRGQEQLAEINEEIIYEQPVEIKENKKRSG